MQESQQFNKGEIASREPEGEIGENALKEDKYKGLDELGYYVTGGVDEFTEWWEGKSSVSLEDVCIPAEMQAVEEYGQQLLKKICACNEKK